MIRVGDACVAVMVEVVVVIAATVVNSNDNDGDSCHPLAARSAARFA